MNTWLPTLLTFPLTSSSKLPRPRKIAVSLFKPPRHNRISRLDKALTMPNAPFRNGLAKRSKNSKRLISSKLRTTPLTDR